MLIEKIISGGQTGADRGGLDAAITLGIPYGGWCPRGRVAEDGRIPDRYQLVETRTPDYLPRTRLNVEDSDGTAIFVTRMTRGSLATVEWCRYKAKPYVIVANVVNHEILGFARLIVWLKKTAPRVLNVAGSRESKAPGIAGAVERILIAALRGPDA